VTKQLLYATKVRAAVKKMRRRAVTQPVRPKRWGTFYPFEGQMHHLPDLALINPPAPAPEKRCRW
jgi:hypothetical protein